MAAKQQYGEAAIIAHLRGAQRADPVGVVVGIGDDAAVTTVPAGMELVTATDALVEGTHFPAGASAASIGHRSLACNLSDLAAMGAEPKWASMVLCLPQSDADWIEDFAAGFLGLAESSQVALIGGDTVRGPLSVSVTVQGWIPAGSAVLRCRAQPGDRLYITGSPGEAAAGRLLLAGELPVAGNVTLLIQRCEYPQPRLAAGLALREFASAMIDISDGVHTDLSRLLVASQVGATALLPAQETVAALTAVAGAEGARRLWLHGGEDYELCFSAAPRHHASIVSLERRLGLPIRCVGEVHAEPGLQWMLDGQPVSAGEGAFEHFS